LSIGVDREEVKSIVAEEGTVLPADCSNFCYLLFDLYSVDLHNADTSNVTNMSSMFAGCGSLESLDLSNFDTSNVTDMSLMFEDCFSLESLDLSSFDTSNVTNMYRMFYDSLSCGSLKSIDLSSFDTSNVTNMFAMFSECESLESLDLSNFDTSNVECMYGMFYICTSLSDIDFSSFDTSNDTDMSNMFRCCYELKNLDLSSFDTSNVKYMQYMFAYNSSLETIIVGDKWSTESVEYYDSMFYLCENLMGEAGTAYDKKHTGIEYAHVDGGKKDPGYFTAARISAENNCNIVVYIPENTMNLLYDLYGNITDPKLKSLASSAKSFLNKFMTFKIV